MGISVLDRETAVWVVRTLKDIANQVKQLKSQASRSWRTMPRDYPPIAYVVGSIVHDSAVQSGQLAVTEVGPDGQAGTINLATGELINGNERKAGCRRVDVTEPGGICVRLTRGIWDAEIHAAADCYLHPKLQTWPESATGEYAKALRFMIWDLYTFGSDLHNPGVTSGTSDLNAGGIRPITDDGYFDAAADAWYDGGEGDHQHYQMFRNTTQPSCSAWVQVRGGDAGDLLIEAEEGTRPAITVPQNLNFPSYNSSGTVTLQRRFAIDADADDYGLAIRVGTAGDARAIATISAATLFLRKCTARD